MDKSKKIEMNRLELITRICRIHFSPRQNEISKNIKIYYVAHIVL